MSSVGAAHTWPEGDKMLHRFISVMILSTVEELAVPTSAYPSTSGSRGVALQSGNKLIVCGKRLTARH